MALRKKDLEDMFLFHTMTLNPSVKSQILKATGRGGVFAARDYISAVALIAEVKKVKGEDVDLSFAKTADDLWAVLDPATRFRLKMYTPCLCERYDGLKESEQKQCFDSKDWVASEKQNGCRGVLIVYNGQVHLFSRNYSDKDCGLLEYWNNIDQQVISNQGIYAIDVEIKFEPGADIREDLENLGLTTDSPLEAMVALLHTYPEEAVKIQKKYKEIYGSDLVVFRLIHPLYFEGKNYLKRPLGEGIDVYDRCVEAGRAIGLNVKPIDRCAGTREEKEVFLNTIISRGGEGVVFWNRKGNYVTSENRSKTSWIKLKRTITDTESGKGLGDTIDAFITGFKVGSNGTANEGLIAAINVSIYVNDNGTLRKHMIASIPNIEKSLKEMMTFNDASGLWPTEVMLSDGTTKWISMNPDFDQLVVECTGQALSAVSQRLEHPRMIRLRPERDPNSCIYTKEWLTANTTNAGISYKQNN